MIQRLLKPDSILLVRASRQLRFLSSLQPPDVILGTFPAMRTTVNRLLYFFFFVKKIAFVHKTFSLRPRGLSFAELTQVPKTINSCFVTVAPAKI